MPVRILVVEDEPILLEALEYNLTRQSYQVYTAGDGLAGLETAQRERPDLIVLDIMLPKMDGLEVCRIVRQEMSTPILMLTARADEVDRVGELAVDLGRGEARLKGEALRLKPKEYDLLVFLARNRGIVLSRDLILERVWGWDFGGGTRTVDGHVRWLREKIDA